jgi:hypothetical protein
VGVVASDREERNRVFGVPIGPAPAARRETGVRLETRAKRETGPSRESGGRARPESQRVLGFPVDWFGPGHQDVLDSLRHPVRGFQRWRQRRAGGP